MPTQTPTGWRIVSQSTLVAMFGSDCPMSRLGMPQANSTISMPRCTAARGFGERLAVLAGDELGQLFGVLLEHVAEAEHDAGPLDGRRFAPGRQRRGGRGWTAAIDFGRRRTTAPGRCTWPVEGL